MQNQTRPGYAACARIAAEYYGRLALVAIAFHIKTGNPAELDAARVYARYAAAYAAEVIA